MTGLERRAAAIGLRAAARLRERVAAEVRDALPGIRIEEAAGGVLLSGRGLVRRVLASARVTGLSAWLR